MNTKLLKKIVGVAVVSAVGVALVATVAIAAKANKMELNIKEDGRVKIQGTVASVVGSTLSLSSWLGTWTITTSGVQSMPQEILTVYLSKMKAGDAIAVNGTIGTGMTVNAQELQDKSMNNLQIITGTISNLNAGAGTFTLTTAMNMQINVGTDASTKVFVNGAASSLTSLSNGAHVVVLGSRSGYMTYTAAAVEVSNTAVQNSSDEN